MTSSPWNGWSTGRGRHKHGSRSRRRISPTATLVGSVMMRVRLQVIQSLKSLVDTFDTGSSSRRWSQSISHASGPAFRPLQLERVGREPYRYAGVAG